MKNAFYFLRATASLFAVVACVSTSALADEASPAQTTALELKHELLQLKLDWFGGFQVHRDGTRLDIGYFGGNVDRYFGQFPEALDSARKFRTFRIVGTTLAAVGIAALVADVVLASYAAANQNQTFFDANPGVAWGLLGGGAALSVAGSIFTVLSAHALVDAVNRHNAGLLNRYLPEGQRIDLNLALAPAGPAAVVTYRF